MKLRWFSYPYVLWMVVFTLAPLLLVAYFAFTAVQPDGSTVFTFLGFEKIVGGDRVPLDLLGLQKVFGITVEVPLYLNVFVKSLQIALLSTLACLLFGYPAAYLLARRTATRRGGTDLLLLLFVIPMWMNALLRTYAWLALLEPNGIVNTMLSAIGLPRGQFLYNDFGIGLGMVYNYLPFMVLPIYSVLVKVDRSVVEAAEDLGADRTRVFTRVVLPLSMPGVMSGINMVFMPAMTTFLIPNLLGGGRYMLIGNVIERQYMIARDWTTASALSIVLLVFVLASMRMMTRYEKGNEGGGVLL
jgi:spermidine/putrescine transport system permease protein